MVKMLCEACAAKGNSTKEQELKNRIRIEDQRRTSWILKRVNGKQRNISGGTRREWVMERGSGKRSHSAIETALLDENNG